MKKGENCFTNPIQLRILALGLYCVALPPKLFNFGCPHSFACNASHFRTSCQACSLLALCILIILSISFCFNSSFFHCHPKYKFKVKFYSFGLINDMHPPFLSIAFQNICWLGYTQNSVEPSGVTFGMLEI